MFRQLPVFKLSPLRKGIKNVELFWPCIFFYPSQRSLNILQALLYQHNILLDLTPSSLLPITYASSFTNLQISCSFALTIFPSLLFSLSCAFSDNVGLLLSLSLHFHLAMLSAWAN